MLMFGVYWKDKGPGANDLLIGVRLTYPGVQY